jgi:hypothetical protein
MRKLSCLLLLAVVASPAWAECDYPKKLGKIPNGNTATRADMVAAQKDVKVYQAEITTYLECIKTEYEAALAKDAATLSDKQKEAMKQRYIQKNDSAVDEAKEVADRWNEQRSLFLAKESK